MSSKVQIGWLALMEANFLHEIVSFIRNYIDKRAKGNTMKII